MGSVTKRIVGKYPSQNANAKYAFANIATGTTDGALVTAVAGHLIRVLEVRLSLGATATSITFNSKGAGPGTAISETVTLAASGQRDIPFDPVGHFETNPGEGLTVTTSAAGATYGVGVVYELVKTS